LHIPILLAEREARAKVAIASKDLPEGDQLRRILAVGNKGKELTTAEFRHGGVGKKAKKIKVGR